MTSLQFNPSAATSRRLMAQTDGRFAQAVQRLSTGLRINSAADDASGLSLSETVRSQVRGLQQAARNAQDGISLIQTAEGALGVVSDMVQRLRELAVRAANGVFTTADRASMQAEADALVDEIDRVGKSTTFNGVDVLGAGVNPTDEGDLTNSLQNQWLRQAEKRIETYYGIVGDGQEMKIVYDTTPTPGVLAFVQASYSGANGRSVPGTIQFHFDMSKYATYNLPDGGASIGGPPTDVLDRTVAHEMTHAIMGRNMDFASLPLWFVEGTAEYMRGADDRLKADIAAAGGGAAGIAALVAGLSPTAWGGTSADYSAAYSAVKYLDTKLQAAGKTMADLMVALHGTGATLDSALTATIGMDNATFVGDFQIAGNGDTFIAGLNLNDDDMGAIGGGSTTDTVPNVVNDPNQPLRHWRLDFPAGDENVTTLQVGAGSGGLASGQAVALHQVRVSAADVGVTGLDISSQTAAQAALDRLDGSIENVASKRALLGATQNKLAYALTSIGIGAENQGAAESRIRDTDVAVTASELLRTQILRQVGTAMLAQSNAQPRSVLSLLG